MSLRKLTGLPADIPTAPGLAVAAGGSAYYHEESGLLLNEIENNANGLAIAKRSRALLIMLNGSKGYAFAAGVAFIDALNASGAVIPTDCIKAMVQTKFDYTGEFGYSITNAGYVAVTPGYAAVGDPTLDGFTNVGGIVMHRGGSPNTLKTSMQLIDGFTPAELLNARVFTFNHGWHSGFGCSQPNFDSGAASGTGWNSPTAKVFTSCFPGKTLAERTVGGYNRWNGNPGPTHTSIALIPTSYSVGAALDKLLSDSEYKSQIKSILNDLFVERGLTNLNNRRLFEPVALTWSSPDLAGSFVSKFVDPLAPPTPHFGGTTPTFEAENINAAHSILFGARCKLTNGAVHFPIPIVDSQWVYAGGDLTYDPDATTGWSRQVLRVATVEGDDVSITKAYKPVVANIDNHDTVAVFGLNPFGLFYTISGADWTTVARNELPEGMYPVANNLAARAGSFKSDYNPNMPSDFGHNASDAFATPAGLSADLASLYSGAGASARVLAAGRSNLDTYCLTARTLTRLVNDLVVVEGSQISFNIDAARAILDESEATFALTAPSTAVA